MSSIGERHADRVGNTPLIRIDGLNDRTRGISSAWKG